MTSYQQRMGAISKNKDSKHLPGSVEVHQNKQRQKQNTRARREARTSTRAGGLVKVLISMMSFLLRAARAFSASSSAGNTCPPVKLNKHELEAYSERLLSKSSNHHRLVSLNK